MNSLNKIFGLYFGLTVFPYFILFGFNFSLYIFLFFYLIISIKSKSNPYKSNVKLVIVLYIIGFTISSLYNFENTSFNVQIFNYLYWILLVHVLIKTRNYITLSTVLKYAFPFYLMLIAYSFLREYAPKNFFLLNYISSNSVAFL